MYLTFFIFKLGNANIVSYNGTTINDDTHTALITKCKPIPDFRSCRKCH